MRKGAIVLSLLFVLLVPGRLLAHEGHEHKVMGTVTVVEKAHLDVETKDGKKVSVLLNKKTKYLKGETPATLADVEVGDRVVLTVVEEGDQMTAREVLLAQDPTKTKKN